MRVTAQMAAGTLINNLDRSYERVVRYQTELSSGTRLNKLSDDPAAVERSLALRSELRNMEQFQKNIDDGTGWLELSEATLSELETLFVEARGLAVQGATSTYNAAQRGAIADQIDQSLEHTLTLSEARYRGRYIFSGTRTSQAPYQAQRDDNGNMLTVLSSGDISGSIKREIADGVSVQVNIPGGDMFADPEQIAIPLGVLPDGLEPSDAEALRMIFGADRQMALDELAARLESPPSEPPEVSPALETFLQDLRDQYAPRQSNPFGVLVELRDALREDSIEGVRATLDKLAAVLDRLSSVRGMIGARVSRMESTRNVLDRVSVEMATILSEDEDVDLISTVVNLQQQQDVYQAALSTGTALIPQTLMDFI
jgi:flagellar hook-associated protein 3 FlgL